MNTLAKDGLSLTEAVRKQANKPIVMNPPQNIENSLSGKKKNKSRAHLEKSKQRMITYKQKKEREREDFEKKEEIENEKLTRELMEKLENIHETINAVMTQDDYKQDVYNDDVFGCNECNYGCDTINTLEKHLNSKHPLQSGSEMSEELDKAVNKCPCGNGTCVEIGGGTCVQFCTQGKTIRAGLRGVRSQELEQRESVDL